MKPRLPVAAVLSLFFTVAAFPQATFIVGSTPVTAVAESGYTEEIGDIMFIPVNPAATLTVPGTITIDLNDNLITYPGDVVVTPPGAVGAVLVPRYNPDELIIQITPGPGTDNYGIRLTGVRIQAAGDPDVAPLDAALSSTGNTIVVGQTNPRVLHAAKTGIASFTGSGPVGVNAVSGNNNGTDTITLTAVEGFRNAFGLTTATDPTQANVQQIMVRLDQAIPEGVTIEFSSTDNSGHWTGGGTLTSVSAFPPTVYYSITSDTDVLTVEDFTITCIITADPVTTTPYEDITIHASVSLAPVHYAGSTDRPRYALDPVGSEPLLEIFHPATTSFDTDGDYKSDIAVWRPDSRVWYVLPSNSPGSFTATQWGMPGDIPVPADFDGDTKSDLAVWRPDSGVWYILPSSVPGSYVTSTLGLATDTPVPRDFDGDGEADPTVWRSDTGTWYTLSSNEPETLIETLWGIPSDTPVPSDFDGDGKADPTVWRSSSGIWYSLCSNAPGTYTATQWGLATDTPVTGDFDGDGKTDPAVWRSSEGTWYILPSNSPGTYTATNWGAGTDVPATGDFDGDGKSDIAVWRPGNGTWYILLSSAPGTYAAVQWGMEDDVIIP